MSYYIRRALAIAGGTGAAAISVALLSKGTHPSTWSTETIATVSLVPLTVVVAVGAHSAWRSGHHLAACVLYLLSIVGSGLIVFENLGIRAETKETKVLAAEAQNSGLEREQKRLAEAQYILASCPVGTPKSHAGVRCGLRDAMAKECASGDGDRCRSLRRSIRVYEDSIVGLEARLAAPSRAPVPVDAQAQRVASLLSWAGVSVPEKAARAGVSDLHSVGLPIFLDLAAITLLIWGIEGGSRQRKRESFSPRPQLQHLGSPQDVLGGSAPLPARSLSRDEVISEMIRMLERGETWSSQEELRERLGLPEQAKGTLSRILGYAERQGQIPRRVQVGRRKVLQAA